MWLKYQFFKEKFICQAKISIFTKIIFFTKNYFLDQNFVFGQHFFSLAQVLLLTYFRNGVIFLNKTLNFLQILKCNENFDFLTKNSFLDQNFDFLTKNS